jgi:hypothetical protein
MIINDIFSCFLEMDNGKYPKWVNGLIIIPVWKSQYFHVRLYPIYHKIKTGKIMLQTISLDSKTIVIKADNEDDLSEIFDYVIKKDRQKNVIEFLRFASENRRIEKIYKFNREDCYDR